MSDVYHGYIAKVEQTKFETARVNQYEARFQWFLLPALVLLLIEVAITTWPVGQAANEARATRVRRESKSGRRNSTQDKEHSTAA
jgi:hypothetical protein